MASLRDSELRAAAIKVLRDCSLETGMQASGAVNGHREIWARDAMIASLGASFLEDPLVRTSLRATLSTLAAHQSESGNIPNHVDLVRGTPNFRAYADGGIWYIVGSSILQPDYPAIARVLEWCRCQDVDESSLLSIQEASDWEDLFCVRGKGLYVNCLYVFALRRAAALAEDLGHRDDAHRWSERARTTRSAINRRLWYVGDGQMTRHIADSFSTPDPVFDSLGRKRWMPQKRILRDAQYYLPYVSFREPGEWFDTLGNLMAILCGVADANQTAAILEFIEANEIGLHPAKALYPPVQPGDPEWRDYYSTLNLPDRYHNGGIWPFIGGFYVAALVKAARFEQAEAALERLAELNFRSNFCEWLHGETLEPIGVREQAWSAGMYLFAAECVKTGAVPYFSSPC